MNAVNPLVPPSPQRPLAGSPDRQAEPSMEEILASIRRIIADDQALPAAPEGAGGRPSLSRPGLPATPASAAAQAVRGHQQGAIPSLSAAEVPSVERPGTGFSAHGQVTAPQFPSPEVPATDDVEPAIARTAARVGGNAGGAALAGDPVSASSIRQDSRMRDHFVRDAGHDRDAEPQREAEHQREAGHEAAPRAPALISPATDQALSSAFNMLAATRLADNSEELRTMAREMIRPLLKSWLDDNLPNLVERLVRAEIERVARGGR